ncbi:PolC-type DNA polymerase III [Sporosarcina pasteurii]|uniref:DNA polymerase III polC-type n=1 Tax=Sporosarcina pasteurii TaxID=1474 RepID=A0A380BD90_SPOPA|nr:exonuclease domain-containing protein [Sporosarcina pasteurii]MDS9472941.1 exonuclease domain-containing protein [Sporosarcina pasteurii]QBQ06482.1 3'-5' exonuclease [Sporosarcina pasteurii]SUI98364.1 DNA polymerase III polC-type [Sporosarcina pasteurii]
MFGRKKRLPYTLSESLQLSTKLTDMSFTVFDTETTGFAIETHDRLIEIGAVHVEQMEVTDKTFQTFANPSREIPAHITTLTSIEQHHVKDAPNSLEAIKNYFQFVEDNNSNCWVGHHLTFDTMVIKKELHRAKHSVELPSTFDTYELIEHIMPKLKALDLEEYAKLFGTKIFERHRALGDALTTAHLFVEIIKRLERKGITTLADLLRIKNKRLILL